MANVDSAGRLAHPFPRHHARRKIPEPLAHGPAPRPGSASTAFANSNSGARCSIKTQDGNILQRAFGGHTYKRLCHVGDRHRPGDDPHACRIACVTLGESMFSWNAPSRACLPDGATASPAASRLLAREQGRFVVFPRQVRGASATGGIGKAYKITSNSWEYTGDGMALAYRAGAEPAKTSEFVQFHPTGMVWPPGVQGLLVTEAVRGEGGILRNKGGERFMEKLRPQAYGSSRAMSSRGSIYTEVQRRKGHRTRRRLSRHFAEARRLCEEEIAEHVPPVQRPGRCGYHQAGPMEAGRRVIT